MYLMTVDPKKAPEQSDRIEIEFSKGMSSRDATELQTYFVSAESLLKKTPYRSMF